MITHYEHVRATNKFIEANLIGAGKVASVYKGVMVDGTPIAGRVFDLQ